MSSDGCSPSGAGNVYPFGTAIFVLFLWGSCCSISCFLCSQSKSRPFHVHDLSPESYHECHYLGWNIVGSTCVHSHFSSCYSILGWVCGICNLLFVFSSLSCWSLFWHKAFWYSVLLLNFWHIISIFLQFVV